MINFASISPGLYMGDTRYRVVFIQCRTPVALSMRLPGNHLGRAKQADQAVRVKFAVLNEMNEYRFPDMTVEEGRIACQVGMGARQSGAVSHLH